MFGESDLGLEPAAVEEFERGIRSGVIFVAMEDGAMIGFVHMEPIGEDSPSWPRWLFTQGTGAPKSAVP